MNKKKLKALLEKKQAHKISLQQRALETEEVSEIRSINTEVLQLNEEIRDLEDLISEADQEEQRQKRDQQEEEQRGQDAHEGDGEQRGQGFNPLRSLGSYSIGDHSTQDARAKEVKEKYEERGAYLKEGRSVIFTLDEMSEFRAISLGSSNLVTETKYKKTLAPSFNEVSGLIDLVNAVPLIGGESYMAGFEKNVGEGGYTTEDGNYTEADPEYDNVSVGKAKITAYSEITDEAKKLPNVDYSSRVANSIAKAIRKKITRQTLIGAGGSNQITGIFNAPANVMPIADTDIEISSIDADTLDKLVFGYGGDEDVEGGAWLILNKKDLAAFASIRSTDGKKLYNITLNGNVGRISSDNSFGVNFIINSAAPALSASGTAANTYCMAYGFPFAYEMPIFSQIEVQESRDYKFRSGQIAFRGAIWIGGNTTMYKGFSRAKKV